MPVPLVAVIRSGVVESVHRGDIVVADPDGAVVAAAGDPGAVCFARSTMKPLQAAVTTSLAGEELPLEQVAVACASHRGEPRHVAAVARILERGGMGFDSLQTPPARPTDPASGGPEPSPELHNCSGKHAAMLLGASRRGWDTDTYRAPSHPIQVAVGRAVEAHVGVPATIGVDGCGVPVHALPLARLAAMYARLVRPDRFGPLAPQAARATEAMTARPDMVGGTGSPCTSLMEAVPGLVAKGGAEGLLCAAITDGGWGVAIKVADGGDRAAAPALVRVLDLLGYPDPGNPDRLEALARPPVMGGGEVVGRLDPVFELQRS